MELKVRQAEAKDIVEMAKLDAIAFTVPWSEDSFRQEILSNDMAFYIVAEINEKLVGYAGLWKIVDEGHITNVAVHPDYRQKGIGKALVGVLIESTSDEGILSYTLEVRQSNLPAILLYSGFGFLPAGVRKKYYEDNDEDAIIMWRHLDSHIK